MIEMLRPLVIALLLVTFASFSLAVIIPTAVYIVFQVASLLGMVP